MSALTLITIFAPCIVGLLLIRWQRKGHMKTPKAITKFDALMAAAIPGSRGPVI